MLIHVFCIVYFAACYSLICACFCKASSWNTAFGCGGSLSPFLANFQRFSDYKVLFQGAFFLPWRWKGWNFLLWKLFIVCVGFPLTSEVFSVFHRKAGFPDAGSVSLGKESAVHNKPCPRTGNICYGNPHALVRLNVEILLEERVCHPASKME